MQQCNIYINSNLNLLVILISQFKITFFIDFLNSWNDSCLWVSIGILFHILRPWYCSVPWRVLVSAVHDVHHVALASKVGMNIRI